MTTMLHRLRLLPVLGLLAVLGSCEGLTVTSAILCQLSDFAFTPTAVTVNEGETTSVDLKHSTTTACDNTLSQNATSDDPTTVTVGAGSRQRGDPNQAGERANTFTIPVTGVRPGGPVMVRVATTAAPAPAENHTVPVTVIATKGELSVTITGLPAGVNADVNVGSLLLDGRKFTASGTGRFRPGPISWNAASVTANGVTYDPTPASGFVTLGVGELRGISVVYAVRVAAAGTANIQVAGLPSGTAASVTVTGNGVNQSVTASGSVTLQPGTYTVAANTVADAVNDYADPSPSRQVTITSGQTTNVLFVYAIVATLVNLNITGLEGGLSPLVTLTRGSETRTVTANTAALRLAVGAWTVAVAERAQSIRTYRGRSATPTTLTVLASTSPMALALAYYCFRWQWQAVATFAVLLDPNGHNPSVALQLAAHLLGVTWLFPEPLSNATEVGGTANQTVTQETVTITGVGSFVTVTGTRASNGALTLTGTGTVAGFTNVPVRLTGTLSGSTTLSALQYRMGQDTAPTGLPGGSITYSGSAPAPSAAGAVLLEHIRPPR